MDVLITTKMNLGAIYKEAARGDLAHAHAIAEFYQSIADENYVVTHEPSASILIKWQLLDPASKKVHRSIRKVICDAREKAAKKLCEK